jgi:peptidoglycan L-alanyl-D-glutamate endopeptidase CwlK
MLGSTSRKRLEGVKPELVRIVELAEKTSPVPFMVAEGVRTLARQKQLFDKGSSKTMNSRHLTGDAVDLVPLVDGKVPWDDKSKFDELAKYIFAAADELGILVTWGGHFKGFYDGPHWQLIWPNDKEKAEALRDERRGPPVPAAAKSKKGKVDA